MGQHSAVVLGAGIAGLAAAIALDRAGWRVDLLERASSIEPIGAALSLWSNAIEALDRLGVAEPLLREAAPIDALAVAAPDGRWLMAPVPIAGARLPTRARLQRLLLDAQGPNTALRLGTAWTRVSEEGEAATTVLASGECLRASLVVDASGIHSPLADRLLGNGATYRGYAGVLALSTPVLRRPDPLAREYWGRGERIDLFDAGEGRRYWFYMRNAASNDRRVPTRRECADRTAGWAAAIGEAIDATQDDSLIPFAIHARTVPRRLGSGRILCIGDAAHAMEPNLGQGACQGLEDAAVLGRFAERLPPEAILPAFERQRLARIRAMMNGSARAGRLVHGNGVLAAAARHALPLIPSFFNRRQIAASHRSGMVA